VPRFLAEVRLEALVVLAIRVVVPRAFLDDAGAVDVLVGFSSLDSVTALVGDSGEFDVRDRLDSFGL
jgi:hypothetical protein